MRASVVLEMPVKGTRPGPINVSDPTSPARDPSSPTSRSPQKSVEDILKEKREAQEALLQRRLRALVGPAVARHRLGEPEARPDWVKGPAAALLL